MSIYEERMASLRDRKDTLQKHATREEANIPQVELIDAKTLVLNTRQLLDDLCFEDKKLVVREIVTKVTATQKEIIICGQIPIPQDAKVGLRAKPWER